MFDFIQIVISQIIPFIPLAYAATISYNILRATDLTLDGSFVLGAGIYALMLSNGVNPLLAATCSLGAGFTSGIMVGLIQWQNKIDSLLAGILASFMLVPINLLIMGKPNINLIGHDNYLSNVLNVNPNVGYLIVAVFSLGICLIAYIILNVRIGLYLRGLGENQNLLMKLGYSSEAYKVFGFGLTNMLAASSGVLTTQCVGYADINMGFGMTLTAIAAIIIGYQLLFRLLSTTVKIIHFEIISSLCGIVIYFTMVNLLLRFDVNPLYLKLFLSIILILFMRLSTFRRNLI
ncbi:MAG: hypothetical protein KBD37_01465 [Burkholderiales bacterium]|nr:hypothetical protein [Burkholderiales bacterium]